MQNQRGQTLVHPPSNLHRRGFTQHQVKLPQKSSTWVVMMVLLEWTIQAGQIQKQDNHLKIQKAPILSYKDQHQKHATVHFF